MGKLTISMAIFNSFLYVYQKVKYACPLHATVMFGGWLWLSALYMVKISSVSRVVLKIQKHNRKTRLCIYVSMSLTLCLCIHASIYQPIQQTIHRSFHPSLHITTLISPHLPHCRPTTPPPFPASAQKPRCTALLAGEEAKVVLFVDPDVGPRAVLWVSGWWYQWMDGPQEWAAKVAAEVWPQQKLPQRTFGKAQKREWGTNSTGSSTNWPGFCSPLGMWKATHVGLVPYPHWRRWWQR